MNESSSQGENKPISLTELSSRGRWFRALGRIYDSFVELSGDVMRWIGIRGKLLLLIFGIIAAGALLGWMAKNSVIDFFEKREKVDLKDESNIGRMRLELHFAEAEAQVRNAIDLMHNEEFLAVMDANQTGAWQKIPGSLGKDSDWKDGIRPIDCWFTTTRTSVWEDESNIVYPEIKQKLASRKPFEEEISTSSHLWSGVHWVSSNSDSITRSARMQLMVLPKGQRLKRECWLITFDVTQMMEKNILRAPREYVFVVNPGSDNLLAFSPFGDPERLLFKQRSTTQVVRDKASEFLTLASGTALKKAIADYNDKTSGTDSEAIANTRRTGLEYPIDLSSQEKGLKVTDLLTSGDTDLSFLDVAWYCDSEDLPAEIVKQLGETKILDGLDIKSSIHDPVRRVSEATGQTRKIHLRAGSAEELERLKIRIEGRLYDLLGREYRPNWFSSKQMDRLVLNVSEVRPLTSKTKDPILYFVRAVSLNEIRESASENLYNYIFSSVLLAVVALSVAAFLAIYITQPLVRMTETVNAISKVGITDAIGSNKIRELLDQLPVSKRDEVGSLATQFQRTFHEMLNQLSFKVKAEQQLIQQFQLSKISQQNEKSAREESRAKSQFLAMISHDMRQPLNMIFTELKLMMRHELSSPQKKKAESILNSARRLKNLIQDILDYQRYMADDLLIEPTEVDVSNFLHEVANQFQYQVAGTGVRLEVVCDFKRTIFVDQAKLERVLVNLMSNSLKFTDQGTVTLQADLLRGNLIQFSVADTGRGMSEEKKSKIFKIQNTANEQGNVDGTGLGLYICKILIDHMHGDIEFDSQLGKGSTFIVTLPMDFQGSRSVKELRDENQNKPLLSVSTPNEPLTTNDVGLTDQHLHSTISNGLINTQTPITVLIIDDQPDAREAIRSSLPKSYRILQAANGKEGLQMAIQQLPDVITLDVEMPEMDGWQVLSELKANPKTRNIPVVMATVQPGQKRAAILGANGFLMKPFDQVELTSAIRSSIVENTHATIMVVDDDSDTRSTMKQFLESNDWTVVTAVDGEDAWKKIQEARPSLLMVDLYMPKMDGFTLIEKLRQREETKDLPIIVLSAAHLTAEKELYLKQRIQQFFGKGTSELNTILNEIQRLLVRPV